MPGSSRGIQTDGIEGSRRCHAKETGLDLSNSMHDAATAARTRRDVDAGEFEHEHARSFRPWFGLRGVCKQSSNPCQALLFGAIGQESEGTDAHEALR